VLCNFDNNQAAEEPADVTAMQSAIQKYIYGIGILGYNDINVITSDLMKVDKMQFQYPLRYRPSNYCFLCNCYLFSERCLLSECYLFDTVAS
jgi:hypothetical protein